MLVLSRKVNEEVVVGREIRVKVLKLGRGRVRLGIAAPLRVDVRRAECPSGASADCRETHESAKLEDAVR